MRITDCSLSLKRSQSIKHYFTVLVTDGVVDKAEELLEKVMDGMLSHC